MKRSSYLIVLIFSTAILFSCEKEIPTTALASLNIANAIVGGTTAKLGGYTNNINNNASAQIALVAGENNLYVWPAGDSLKPYFTSAKFKAEQNAVYSLFLTGTPTASEGILVKESIPYRKDSTAGIRFINLAPNKPSLNITLSTSTTVNEVSALTYKNYTEFKTYPGLSNSTYSYQVRDAAAPGTVLTTFSLNAAQVPRFANITLVIRQNGATGVSVFRMNNDR